MLSCDALQEHGEARADGTGYEDDAPKAGKPQQKNRSILELCTAPDHEHA